MDRAAPDQPDRPYRGRRGGANRRVQVFYNAQDLASGAIRRLVRIQGQTPNFIIPRRQYDQNDPYVALIVNVDWYGVQSLLADEITRLAPYIPGLDAQVQAARQAAAQGAADGAPEPEHRSSIRQMRLCDRLRIVSNRTWTTIPTWRSTTQT